MQYAVSSLAVLLPAHSLEVVLLFQPASWSYYILDPYSLLLDPVKGDRDKEDVARETTATRPNWQPASHYRCRYAATSPPMGRDRICMVRKSDRRSPCAYRSDVNCLYHMAALSRQRAPDTSESGLPTHSGRQPLNKLFRLWSAVRGKLLHTILVSSHKERDRHQIRR